MDQLLYGPEEGAKIIGIQRTTMFDLLRRGEIESVKLGRLRRIPRDALVAYVARLREEQRSNEH